MNSQTKKIIIDAIFFQYNRSGIARVWKSLLEEWTRDGFVGNLLVLDRQGTAPQIAGITYRMIPAHNYATPEQDKAMLQQVCDEEGADLFISTYYTAPITTPSVFMAYDMIPEVMNWDISGNAAWIQKHAGIRHAGAFIAISHNTAKDLRRYFPTITADQVSVAHCGVDFKSPGADRIVSFKTRYGIRKPYFLLVGSRTAYKNGRLFFQAFESFGTQRANYAIVCTGPWGTTLEAEFVDFVGAASLHMVELDDSELQCAYASAIALVYPSIYEGFGMPITEAMACACPVITCASGSIPEVAGDAVLYVAPTDVVAMANALIQVQESSIREDLIAKGLQRAALFSWEKMAIEVKKALLHAIHVENSRSKENCRLCGNVAKYRFSKLILNKYNVSYFECGYCHSLQTETPYWLEEAYSPQAEKFDTGKASRTLENFFLLPSLYDILGVNRNNVFVDWGGGSGLLTRLLRDVGINCYCYDLYSNSEFSHGFLWQSQQSSVAIISAFEVIENFPNLVTGWDSIFKLNPDYFVCSTERYTGQREEWFYLSPEDGQRIFFYSSFALALIAGKRGYTVYPIGSYLVFCKQALDGTTRTQLADWASKRIECQKEGFLNWISQSLHYAIRDNQYLSSD
jgi:glycosyltransferase involved in cell wall biosynthesis